MNFKHKQRGYEEMISISVIQKESPLNTGRSNSAYDCVRSQGICDPSPRTRDQGTRDDLYLYYKSFKYQI